MGNILISEKTENQSNLLYVQTELADITTKNGFSVNLYNKEERCFLSAEYPDCYSDVFRAEIISIISEIICINYKNRFIKNNLRLTGISDKDKSLLIAFLISADYEDDKKYVIKKIGTFNNFAIDGLYNFMIKPLIEKWQDIINCLPYTFTEYQLKEFVGYLLENKRKNVYIENGNVYDSFYRKLRKSDLLDGNEIKITRETVLSNCGKIMLKGELPVEDEFYLKEYYGDKITFFNQFSY